MTQTLAGGRVSVFEQGQKYPSENSIYSCQQMAKLKIKLEQQNKQDVSLQHKLCACLWCLWFSVFSISKIC